MPKDETILGHLNHSSSNNTNFILNSAEKLPLKRGDACLYCRRRRIRCSARKPQCHNCEKLDRECVYDTGKPLSRVKQLEEKVAELEGILKTGSDEDVPSHASQQQPNSFAVGSGSLPADFSQSGSANGFLNLPIDVDSASGGDSTGNLPDFFPTFGGYSLNGNQTNSLPTPGPSVGTHNPSPEDLFDFSTLDPKFMNLVNSFQNTSTDGSAPSSQPQPPAAAMDYDPFSNGGSTGLTSFIDPNMGGSPTVPPSTASIFGSPSSSNRQPSAIDQKRDPTSSSQGVSYQAYVTDISDIMPTQPEVADVGPASIIQSTIGVSGEHPALSGLPPHNIGLGGPLNGAQSPRNANGWKKQAESDGPGMDMVGGWFDAADLPRVARDHLLDLFFSGMKLFGQEFHIPRFFASLSLPSAKRPHPCLLYSMYLMASRISSSQAIRSLEMHFYSIAARQLDESITKADRLFDAVRAASILAVYKYSHARYHEGWMMTGQAARLAVSCGLHQIPSNLFKPSAVPKDQRADLIGLMRHRTYVLEPPVDAIELGERVSAFWSIFMVERCGSISSQWPTSIPDDIITTPYPRPLHEYELGLVNEADHISISTLYDPSPFPPLPTYFVATYVILRIRAIAILDRSSKLMYLRPEAGWQDRLREKESVSPDTFGASISSLSPPNWLDEYLSTDWNMASSPQQGDESSRRGSTTGPGWLRTSRIRTPQAHEEVKRALLQIEGDLPPDRRTEWGMWDGRVQAWHENPKKDVFSLHFVLGCAWMFLFDVFSFNAQNAEAVAVARRLVAAVRAIVTREDFIDDFDIFIVMTWFFVVKVLIREMKRLQSLRDPSAADLEADVEVIVKALRQYGNTHHLAMMQALRADRYRKSTAEDMSFMEGDTLDDERASLGNTVETGGD